MICGEIKVETISFISDKKEANKEKETIISPELKQVKKNCYELSVSIFLVLENCKFIAELKQSIRVKKEDQSELQFTPQLMDDLLQPFFQILKRLVYDITEIVFDEPGIKVSFIPEEN